MSNDLWIAGAVLIILGLILDIAGQILKSYYAANRPYEGYAEAEVVDVIPIKRGRNALSEFRNRQAAVFEFYAEGKLIKIIDQEDTFPCPYKLHQRVRLNYDPKDPDNYVIIREQKLYYRAVAVNVSGVALILIGVILFLVYALRFR